MLSQRQAQHAVYKRLTLVLKSHLDWRDGKSYFKQIITTKAGIAILISDKIDFKNRKKKQIILLHNDKVSVHQKDTPIVNIYGPIITVLKNKAKLRRINSNTIITGDFHQFRSVAQSCPTLYNPMDCSIPGLSVHHQLPEFTQTHLHWVGDAIQPSHPLSFLPFPASIFASIRVFSNESVLIRWPKYWSFSISPSNEHPGLISLDGLVGSPCSPRDSQESSPTPQFKSIILWRSVFFIVQLLYPYMTSRKTIALTFKQWIAYPDRNWTTEEQLWTI